MAKEIDYTGAERPANRFINKMKNRSKKNDIIAAQYAAYVRGLSLEGVAKLYSYKITRQSLYENFRCRGYPLRKKNFLPVTVYDGIRWTRESHYGYMRATFRHKNVYLHRYIWEKHRGKIPPGHGIHHKDNNPANNKLSNLECLTIGEISSKHNPHRNQYTRLVNPMIPKRLLATRNLLKKSEEQKKKSARRAAAEDMSDADPVVDPEKE